VWEVCAGLVFGVRECVGFWVEDGLWREGAREILGLGFGSGIPETCWGLEGVSMLGFG
jgi:hypothetical protein